MLGTRDCYVNNDQQPMPLSFTAATERVFFFIPSLVWVQPAVPEFGSVHMQMIQVEEDGSKEPI